MSWTTVAALEHLNHNTDETAALLWTADVDALIRVTTFLENHGNVGGASFQITYTDTFGTVQTFTSGFSSTPEGKIAVFKVKAATTVTLTTSGLAGLGSPSNGYIAIEELQATTTLV